MIESLNDWYGPVRVGSPSLPARANEKPDPPKLDPETEAAVRRIVRDEHAKIQAEETRLNTGRRTR